ncbi:MAG: alcohol dehydrogenase catalytic domain-containing protein [Acidimicrobiales bacterium]
MKAAVLHEYGPPEVLHVEEVAKLLPGDGDVLIKVHATSVNFGDTLVRNFKAVSPRAFHMPSAFWLIGRASFGLAKPRRTILGSEFSGDVAEVGKAVTARLALIHLVIHRTAKRRTGFRPRV